ncbi:MAG: translation initiation factor IF-2 N-terminal domain-containing protein, partial [Verrucomicrobiota bacterium]|nr:translation initiation factor IF-2 N-terminal domain-containing protein [Verrucomicrobiota bacterium]
MSVRVHQLSKKIGMDNKELLRLLSERGFEVKSASSTIDNISAESLVEEFAPKPVTEETTEAPSEPKKDLLNESSAPAPPLGSFVKSQEDINQLRKGKAGNVAKLSTAVQAELKDKTVSVSNDSSVSKSPPPSTIPAVNSDLYASAKPPLSSPPSVPVAGPPKPPAVPKIPAAQDLLDTHDAADELNEGDSEAIILHVKPPIVVRDFAVEIGLKPFKLISELMEMGIFASMN